MDLFHRVSRLIAPDIGRRTEILCGTCHQFASGIAGCKFKRFNIEGLGQDDKLKGCLFQGNTPSDDPKQILDSTGIQTHSENADMGCMNGKSYALSAIRLVFQANLPVTVSGRI